MHRYPAVGDIVRVGSTECVVVSTDGECFRSVDRYDHAIDQYHYIDSFGGPKLKDIQWLGLAKVRQAKDDVFNITEK